MPGHERFPNHERLTRRRDFQRLYREAEKRVGPFFVVFQARSAERERKFGVAVSRKVGGAVVRNRVKRYLREYYRHVRGQLPQDLELVIVARPAAARLDYAACVCALQRLLKGSLPDG